MGGKGDDIVMTCESLFTLGNSILLVGTLILIREVIKNRETLKGYHPLGCILTFIAILCFDLAYLGLGFLIPILIASVNMGYWGVAGIYSSKIYLKKRLKKRVKQ